MNWLKKKNVVETIPFLLLFALYSLFLSRDVFGGDVGDLVTASYLHGVAHPPGYPLFTLLGFILTKVLFFLPPVYAVGLISAASSALTIYIIYKLAKDLSRNKLIAYISSFTLAFSYLFWLYSEIAEVFALNNLLAILFFYLSYLFNKSGKVKFFYLAALVLGLGLSNHHTVAFVAIGSAPLYIKHIKKLLKPASVVKSALFLLLGLSTYLYVIFAALSNPIINWNGEPTLQNLIDLFTRRIYGTFQASVSGATTIEEKWVIFNEYITSLISNLSPIVIALCGVGGVFGFKKYKSFVLSVLLILILTGPLFSVYAAFPLRTVFNIGVAERFHILSFMFLCLLLPIGINTISTLLKTFFSNPLYPRVIVGALLLIPVLLFLKNYKALNLSSLSIGNQYGANLIKSLPQSSTLLLSGDTALFDTWYVHYVLGQRKDVRISHYPGTIGDRYVQKIREEYEKTNKKTNFWDYLLKRTKVFSVNQIDTENKNLAWVPYGLYYELTPKSNLPSKEAYVAENNKLWDEILPPKYENLRAFEKNASSLYTLTEYSQAASRIGVYLYAQYKDFKNAEKFTRLAIEIDPSNARPYAALALVLQTDENRDCDASYNYLRKAILLNPSDLSYFLYIPLFEKSCKVKVMDSEFEKAFVEKFGVSTKIFMTKRSNENSK